MKLILVIFALLAFSSYSTVKAQDCGTCELVVNFIEQWVESNATESQILTYLDTICALFPSYQTTCDAVANQGLAQIITWINADETPETICTQLGMCSSKINKPLFNKVSPKITNIKIPNFTDLKHVTLPKPSKIVSKPTKVNDAECSGCDEVISVIENWLEQANNQQEVISAVEIVCTYMPGWETTCDAIVSTGVPTVVNWIETEENSTVVCDQLELCGTTKVIHVADDCGECSQVITMIENYVATNTSESAIENYVSIACTFVPQWTSMCTQYIDGEVPQIIQWIEQNESAATICSQIGLCSSKKVNIN